MVDVTEDATYVLGSPDWSPDGRRVVFQEQFEQFGPQAIVVLDLTTQTRTNILNSPSADWEGFEPQWSPDGHSIVYADRNPGGLKYDLWLINPDGSDARQLTHDISAISPSWSPDGSRIAFTAWLETSGPAAQNSVWVLAADGGVPELMAGSEGASVDDW